MTRRHPSPLPRLWLFTDPRIATADLLAAAQRLPKGAGIVLRNGEWSEAERARLAAALARIARRRGLLLSIAGPDAVARRLGGAMAHGRGRSGRLARSVSAHDIREIRQVECAGAALLFVSPVHATASHDGARPLGIAAFARLAAATRLPVIALGGMTHAKARMLDRRRIYGWAAIDGLVTR